MLVQPSPIYEFYLECTILAATVGLLATASHVPDGHILMAITSEVWTCAPTCTQAGEMQMSEREKKHETERRKGKPETRKGEESNKKQEKEKRERGRNQGLLADTPQSIEVGRKENLGEGRKSFLQATHLQKRKAAPELGSKGKIKKQRCYYGVSNAKRKLTFNRASNREVILVGVLPDTVSITYARSRGLLKSLIDVATTLVYTLWSHVLPRWRKVIDDWRLCVSTISASQCINGARQS
ncbi:hypothetical protein VNO77_38894 [Canavalia gladiata]|uniref:Uncharacterized protein n=1 Tax=Canavalia gladiata TaxID=3824 RepID=A0AAN9PVC0_CANGL